MGASLLAKAAYQTTYVSTDAPLSRAGSLPQGDLRCSADSSRNPVNCRTFFVECVFHANCFGAHGGVGRQHPAGCADPCGRY
ncbi:hypothetical protein EI534_02840 [Pseudomonas frederiksbergensis]|nr:hypothetical protein [Pseudomonas frederiksbergensis]